MIFNFYYFAIIIFPQLLPKISGPYYLQVFNISFSFQNTFFLTFIKNHHEKGLYILTKNIITYAHAKIIIKKAILIMKSAISFRFGDRHHGHIFQDNYPYLFFYQIGNLRGE